MESGLEGVRRTGRGESIGAEIHICMETTQGHSLCSYLYLKLAKHHASYFIFIVLCFFFYKIREHEGRTDSAVRIEVGTTGKGEMVGKRAGG
jgi:hypothetical protein